MRKNGRLTAGGVIKNDTNSLRSPLLKDEARRLINAYLDTFKKAPESDYLLKRYFFTMYFEKN
jgi:hypothetical protein